MARKIASEKYLDKVEAEVTSNQSRLSLVLGALIVLVIAILLYNYFNRPKTEIGPSQQNQQEETMGDVSPDKLPGKYTVKKGDTLFLIAEKYYKDGDKFTEIAKANNLADVNVLETDQVLEIPKLAEEVTAVPTQSPQVSPAAQTVTEDKDMGGVDTTVWGSKIEGDTYIVAQGDWLSTISARAYGDIYAYDKVAKANNIPNPDLIYPGQVLTIPR